MDAYYTELARRSLLLVNGLQYENGCRLLVIGMSEPEDGEAPEPLLDAFTEFTLYLNASHPSFPADIDPMPYLNKGCDYLETYLREVPVRG